VEAKSRLASVKLQVIQKETLCISCEVTTLLYAGAQRGGKGLESRPFYDHK